jgi:hypothetical protein
MKKIILISFIFAQFSLHAGLAGAGWMNGKVVLSTSEEVTICQLLKEYLKKQGEKCEIQDKVSGFHVLEGELDKNIKKNQKVIIKKDGEKAMAKVTGSFKKDDGLEKIAKEIVAGKGNILWNAKEGDCILLKLKKGGGSMDFTPDDEVKLKAGKKRRMMEGC